ncbi:MAG: asparagine synthase (glutamine-hydrolyzing) [Crocinitomicaceae bacterium]|nr:asparagine synthase (glutamine-hydrolyzing) [Crocinitomicaceae bacterium]
MCGINGIFHFENSKSREGEIQKMNETLRHRGPDASGVFADNEIELGHQRLSIIDVSEAANQPIESADGNLILVFNGEIYNYKEVRNQLADYPFKTQSDTEVVLAAFLKWGENALRIFNGIFAFAVWNKTKKELFIARDRLGVKPLYYLTSNDVFVFSSSLKSILSTGRSSAKISKAGLIDYLRYQTVHAPQTIIEDIHVLMPGYFIKINEEDGAQFKSYWSVTKNIQQIRYKSAEEVQKMIRTQLYKSVEMQLVSDVPFGAFLSGGIDSSLMVAIMSQVRTQKTDTFSVTFKEDQFSEKKYAEIIAKKYGTLHHEIELSVDKFRDMIPEALSYMDHPSGDGPNTFAVSKLTREEGVKMAISGLGGDELFAGYPVFRQLPELHRKKWLRSFPAYARRPFARVYKNLRGSVSAAKKAALLSLEEFDTENIYPYFRKVYMDEQIIKLVNYPNLTPDAVYEITHELVGYKTDGWNLPLLGKISVAEVSTYMQNVLLRDADQMSMAHALEVRVPFLDHELVEKIIPLPDSYKSTASPKKIVTDTFSDLLPEEIYNREKMGFVLPYDVWMKNELRTFCESHLNWLKDSGYFNAAELDKNWNLFLKGSQAITWSRIWILVVLSNWMQQNNVR